jgi:hypothetical protein
LNLTQELITLIVMTTPGNMYSLSFRSITASALLLNLAVRLFVAMQPIEHIDSVAMPDDTYLALTIARNIAEGNGSTYTGEFTNGYQPLYVFLTVPFFWIAGGEPLFPVKAAVLLLTIFDTMTLFLLLRLISTISVSSLTPVLIASAWIFNPMTIKVSVNGMETAVAAFFIAAILLRYHRYITKEGVSSPLQIFLLGALFGAGILARIDTVILVAAMSGMIVWKIRDDLRMTAQTSVFIAAGIALTYAPWFVYSWINSGDLFPVSGKAIRFMELQRSEGFASHTEWLLHTMNAGMITLFQNNRVLIIFISVIFLPVLFRSSPITIWIGNYGKKFVFLFMAALSLFGFQIMQSVKVWTFHGVIDPGGAAVIAAGVVAVTVTVLRGSLFHLHGHRMLVLPLFVFGVTLFFSYTLYIFGEWFFDRYLHPLSIAVLIVAALLFDRTLLAVRSKRLQALIVSVTALCIAGMNIAHPDFQKLFRPQEKPNGYMQIGLWAERTFPPGTVIGACQSGALGYFAKDLTVVNLDGVVNKKCYEALVRRKSAEYILSSGIEYVVGWHLNYRFLEKLSDRPLDEVLIDGTVIDGITSWSSGWMVHRVHR